MDQTDLRILRDMGYIPFIRPEVHDDPLKPGAIARRLGLTPELVRDRIAAMERAGIVSGYQIYPNLRHLGLHQATFNYHVPDDRRTVFAQSLADIDGIQALMDYVGGEVCVDMVYRTEGELARRLGIITRLIGDDRHLRIYQAATPPVREALSLLDWRIIQALRGRARRPLSEVATGLGISNRTAKRRYDRMVSERSIDTIPVLDPSRIPGAIPFELAVTFDKVDLKVARTQLLHAFDDCCLVMMQPPSVEIGHFVLALTAPSPRAMEDLRRQAESIPGVIKVRALIPCGATHFHSWADEAIEAKINELAGLLSKPTVAIPLD